MTGYFKGDNELDKVDVLGDGETLYYIEEDNGSIIGLNKAEANKLTIYFKDKKPKKIKFFTKTKAVLNPPDTLEKSDMYLKDFIWHKNKRPLNKKEIFNW